MIALLAAAVLAQAPEPRLVSAVHPASVADTASIHLAEGSLAASGDGRFVAFVSRALNLVEGQIDESQAPLPMVGEAGSQVAVSGAEPTPPPESILDYLDSAPTPAGAQEATKPAANQAPRPAVQAPPP